MPRRVPHGRRFRWARENGRSKNIRTLTRSVGLATVMPMAPVVRPAAIFKCSGTSPTWSLPTKKFFTWESNRGHACV
jgi:hypothetical protein